MQEMHAKNKGLALRDLRRSYSEIRHDIDSRLLGFEALWKNAEDEEIFIELVFCLFTPQSKAKSCWAEKTLPVYLVTRCASWGWRAHFN